MSTYVDKRIQIAITYVGRQYKKIKYLLKSLSNPMQYLLNFIDVVNTSNSCAVVYFSADYAAYDTVITQFV